MNCKIDLEIIFKTKLKEIKDEAKYSNCNNNDNGVYKILKCKMYIYNKYCR